MKKILLFALAVAATVSCKRAVDVNSPVTPEPTPQGDVIALSAMSGAAVTMAGETPGLGVRKDFILGDQIALFAAYGKLVGTAAPTEPEWKASADVLKDSADQVGPYFVNWPANCIVAGSSTSTAVAAKFSWGIHGEGGVNVDRIYPRNKRSLFVYAYYPFYCADTVKLDETKGPLVSISLKDVGAIEGDTPLLQPDILYAKGKSAADLDTVNRIDPLAPLVFNHALAQVNFKVQREVGAAEAKLRKIQFIVPKAGVMTVVDGKVEITAPVTASPADSITYVITDKKNDVVPVGTPLTVLEANPLMILPLTKEQAQKCRLLLTVYYGAGDPDADDKNYRTFDVKLNIATMTEIAQGKKNTLTMKLSETGIALEGTITPWDQNGSTPEIPVE